VATRLSPEGADRLLASVAVDAGVQRPFVAPVDVEVVRRSAGERSWLFVINHSAEEARLEAAGVELISGATVDDTLIVPAGRVAIVRLSAAQ
jgi:beta-galactosidase